MVSVLVSNDWFWSWPKVLWFQTAWPWSRNCVLLHITDWFTDWVKYEVSLHLLLLLLLLWRAHQATAYMGEQKYPEEMRKSTRLWIRRDLSLPCDSWQPFYWLGHHSRAAVIARSWRIVDHCQTIDVDDIDKLSSCSRFSDSVVGFTGQKTQPTVSKYWRSTLKLTLNTFIVKIGTFH